MHEDHSSEDQGNPPSPAEPAEFSPRTPEVHPGPGRLSSRHWTSIAKDTITHQTIGGMVPSEIARFHSVDVADIHRLLNTKDMKDRLAGRRAELMEASTRIMFKWMLHADRLADDQVKDALDPSSPNQYKARTYILDQVSPKRTISQQQVDVHHHATYEIMLGLKDVLTEIRSAVPNDPSNGGFKLLDGKTALPPVDIELDDADL